VKPNSRNLVSKDTMNTFNNFLETRVKLDIKQITGLDEDTLRNHVLHEIYKNLSPEKRRQIDQTGDLQSNYQEFFFYPDKPKPKPDVFSYVDDPNQKTEPLKSYSELQPGQLIKGIQQGLIKTVKVPKETVLEWAWSIVKKLGVIWLISTLIYVGFKASGLDTTFPFLTPIFEMIAGPIARLPIQGASSIIEGINALGDPAENFFLWAFIMSIKLMGVTMVTTIAVNTINKLQLNINKFLEPPKKPDVFDAKT